MPEQVHPDELGVPDVDAAEQALPIGDGDEAEAPQPPWDANPADAAEQAQEVPVDEDEYR